MAILPIYADQRTRSFSIMASSSAEQAESQARPSVDKSAAPKYAQTAQVDLDSLHFTPATQILRRYCDDYVNACLGRCGRDAYIISGYPFLSFVFPPTSPAVFSFPLQHTNVLHLTSLEASPVTVLTLSTY